MILLLGLEFATFFMEHHFYLKEPRTDGLRLFRIDRLADSFLKNEQS